MEVCVFLLKHEGDALLFAGLVVCFDHKTGAVAIKSNRLNLARVSCAGFFVWVVQSQS